MLISVKLTVLFNDPFWIGIFEIQEGDLYKVSKVTFGSEPKDSEVLEFILKSYYKLNFSSAEVHQSALEVRKINPKKQQREIRNQLKNNEIGTKAQQALKKQHEVNKVERKKKSKEQKVADEIRKFEIRQTKRKEKHKGH